MKNENYVIGLDYGTDSVRALIVDAFDGEEIATSVHNYSRWAEGKYCNPSKNQFRQHPLDYLEGVEIVVRESLESAPEGTAQKVRAISIDTTGSTPIAVDKEGTALALKKGFADNPNAMFVLWKDHTAIPEAEEINALAKSWGGVDYTKYSGGTYSSEWFFSKILHILREDKEIREAAFSWVEHSDWQPAVLTGNTDPLTLKRSRCSAGHKAMWHEEFGGLPSQDFLSKLDPLMDGIRDRLYTKTHTADEPVGTLSREWSDKLGLSTDVIVTAGAIDAHIGAVGGCIKPYTMIKVTGTSTCDMIIAPMEEVGDRLINGICGQVDGSIVPGMLGMEAGQSAFGDLYAWYKKVLMWPVENLLNDKENAEKISDMLLAKLGEKAAEVPIAETGITAMDWINGRRTPDADPSLKCAINGLSMGSDAPGIYKALVEATAFGAKKIIDRFREEGVEIREVIALGGIAKKSEFVMQTVADVLGLEIKVVESEQACALGAAMFAAVAAGIYPDISTAQDSMGSGFCLDYKPNSENSAKYAELYYKYIQLGNFIENQE